MKKLLVFYLPDCNVSKTFEERLHKALVLFEFNGLFDTVKYNMYNDYSRQEAKKIGVSDAPTAYCEGNVIYGVQSDYTMRKFLRSCLGK